jgi:hypothetical protein
MTCQFSHTCDGGGSLHAQVAFIGKEATDVAGVPAWEANQGGHRNED